MSKMTKITVLRPFGLRLTQHAPLREFTPGEHEIGEEELGHWFVQACLKSGKAVLTAEPSAPEPAPEPESAPEPAPEPAKAKAKAKK